MRHLAKTLTQVITTTTIGLALLAFPATVLADRDKAQSFHGFKQHQGHEQKERYRADSIKANHKSERRDVSRDDHRDNRDRVEAFHHFNGNNYQQWRNRRNYIVLHQTRSYSDRYYHHPEYHRYRAHYLRYHNGHRVVHHHHDDSYLEWVTTMLLLNEILDDDYR